MIVAFTGHRPNKLGGYCIPNPKYIRVTECIREKLQQLKPAWAISGMAVGVDQWSAQICVELSIPFLAAVPFANQESMWPAFSRKEYYDLLKEAFQVVIVSPGEYTPLKMQIRNEYMVDKCDVLIAVFDGTPGGTANCVRYAEEKGKRIELITP